MRLTSTILVYITWTLSGCGPSGYTGITNDDSTVSGDPNAKLANIDSSESAIRSSGNVGHSDSWNRFPTDESVGERLSGADAKSLVTITDIKFQPRKGLPSWGYVPIEAMGHTLSVKLNNSSDKFLADVELNVIAVDAQTNEQLAVLLTDSVLPYFMIPPKTATSRTVELTFGRNGEDQSPFAPANSWPKFNVLVEVSRIRLVEKH